MDYYGADLLLDHDDQILRDVPDDHLVLHRHQPQRSQRQRSLEGGGGGNNQNQYLLMDKDGITYDPYSLAWRYLGIYIDCDINAISTTGGGDDNDHNRAHRQLPGEEENNSDQCPRKLLWAAYIDSRYENYTIEEYKFYDILTGEWDNSTCLASGTKHRCVNLNCHEPHTKNFKLVGVFKETNGLYDWFEQLFKHEGTCIWNDEDVYDTMTSFMEKWPSQCKKLDVRDDDGNTLYMSTAPLPEGNMTLGIYTDSSCVQMSESIDYTAYIMMMWENYYQRSYYYGYGYYYRYYYNKAQEMIQTYTTSIATWNEYMSVFKICQPCKAYNLQWNQQQRKGDKHERREGRLLENNKNNNNDGDGVEQARYNCYDAAGYTNVNQCYKFESKTSMAIAEPEDMARASEQGSILLIKAYGNVYGEGGYVSPPESDMQAAIYISLAVLAACCVVMGVGCIVRRCCCRARQCKIGGSSKGETFYEDESDFDDHDADVTTSSKSSAGSSRWNRFRRKKRRVADKDIESGGYTPPYRPETPPWLNATSVSPKSFEIEIEMKYCNCTFHNDAENGPIAGNDGMVSTLPEAPFLSVASVSAPLPPPLPHAPDEEVLHNAKMEESNLIGNEAELSSSGNDGVQIACCSQNDLEMPTNNPSDTLIASPMTESESVNHNIETNNASECEGSTDNNLEDESSAIFSADTIDIISIAVSAIIPSNAAELKRTIVALNDSPSPPIEEVAATDDDDSSSFAVPALLLAIVIKQEAASVLIQSKWRRAIALTSFRRKRNAAIICQRNLRRWVAERRVDQPRSLNGK